MGNVPKIQREEGKIALSFPMAEEGVWEGVRGPHLGPTPVRISSGPGPKCPLALHLLRFGVVTLRPIFEFLKCPSLAKLEVWPLPF